MNIEILLLVLLVRSHSQPFFTQEDIPHIADQPEQAVGVNCGSDNSNSQGCLYCAPSYFKTGRVCICKDPFCWLFRLSDLECTQCKMGFILKKPENYCVPDFTGCKEVDSTGKCTVCVPGSILANGGCSTQKNQICTNPDRKFPSQCLLCASQFYLQNGVCWTNTIKVCVAQEENPKRCKRCFSVENQILIGGQCYNRGHEPDWWKNLSNKSQTSQAKATLSFQQISSL